MRISYDPATSCSTVDDRWTSSCGVQRGQIEVHREPYGQARVEFTAMLYAFAGRLVRLEFVPPADDGVRVELADQANVDDRAGQGSSDGA